MNRKITCSAAFAFLAMIMFPAPALADGHVPWMSPEICSQAGTGCTRATVTYEIVPTEDGKACLHLHGSGAETTYSCRIRWHLTLHTYGTATCGWAWMDPTGEVISCVALSIGITLPKGAAGEKTYTVVAGTRTVLEPLWICIDYSTHLQSCGDSPFHVPATLPALSEHALTPGGVSALLESAEDTARKYAAAAGIPPI